MIQSLPRLSSVQPTSARCELIKARFVNDLVCTSAVRGNGVKPLPSQGALHSLPSLNRLDGRGADVGRGAENL